MSQDIEDIKSNLPKPDCTFADHSYPAYSRKIVADLIAQRDELLSALKMCAAVCSGDALSKSELIRALEMAKSAIAKAVQP